MSLHSFIFSQPATAWHVSVSSGDAVMMSVQKKHFNLNPDSDSLYWYLLRRSDVK